jgi:hypothetical protein
LFSVFARWGILFGVQSLTIAKIVVGKNCYLNTRGLKNKICVVKDMNKLKKEEMKQIQSRKTRSIVGIVGVRRIDKM